MFSRIKGVLLQEYFITSHSLEILVDIFLLPAINIIVFGYVSVYLAGSANRLGGEFLLLGMLLWQIVYIVQYSMATGTLWNMWSRNLTNVFITPLTIGEYFLAQMFSGTIKAILLFFPLTFVSIWLFQFNIYRVGILNLLLFFINLTVFSWSFGILVVALIFRYGTKIQAFAWGAIFLIQPLTASLFPISVLPPFLRPITYIFPPTFIFEAARMGLYHGGINWKLIGLASGEI